MHQTEPSRDSGESAADEQLISALLAASRTLIAVSARSLSEIHDSLTLPQFRSLVVLDSAETTTLGALAAVLDVNSSTALRSVDRLVAAGLVSRRENPSNRREVMLGLTSDGHLLVARVTAKRRAEIAGIVAGMPVEQRADLISALEAFTRAAGERPAGSAVDRPPW